MHPHHAATIHHQPSTVRHRSLLLAAWLDGWRRVASAPAVAAGVFLLTFALAWPLALAMRNLIETHLGASATAAAVAEGVDYDWWQEFTAQAGGLGATFSPAIVGFASTLDTAGRIADRRATVAPVAGALALYLLAWTFLAGGILDRYARQRPTRAYGFFAASGVYFFRFLRLAIPAVLFYWWMFAWVHPWLFDEVLVRLTRDLTVERTAFLWRVLFYAIFGAGLVLANVSFDYAKVRMVVEDRRSALGALAAALRFVTRRPGAVLGLYATNALVFLVAVAIWAAVAPGASGAGAPLWAGFAAGQLYLLARLVLKLQFLASQTALFQASLAHAAYTAAPAPAWPESPAAEAVGAVSSEPPR